MVGRSLRFASLLLLGVPAVLVGGCSRTESATPVERPNVVWVVWDTVRADRMSLYGHDKPTTPFLDEWTADGARVFDDCMSTACSTVPSHASMFTGLLPSEHDTNNRHRWLEDHYTTIAELFQDAGYQTYLFAANPHISAEWNFHQGFDVGEHPWDPAYMAEALRIVRGKINPADKSSELGTKLEAEKPGRWAIKACGELAHRGTEAWLAGRDPERPSFIFLNYMEAHRPFIPPESFRRQMMTAAQVEQSYRVDRSWIPMWSFTFGLHEYAAEELAVMAATYDACLAELDTLFHNLLQMIRQHLDLDNTIIVLTADHGEHLGEHHMLDHQYALYNPLIHVPLVVRYPKGLEPGRDDRPVMTFDLFPTLLELASIDAPPAVKSQAVSLLSSRPDRVRLAEYPAPFPGALAAVQRKYPDTFDPTPWIRVLRAFHDDDYKYIWASDGVDELYDFYGDRGEQENLIEQDVETHRDMRARLDRFVSRLTPPLPPAASVPAMTDEMRRRLASLGYGGDDDEPEDTGKDPTWPSLPMPEGKGE